jgi:hypothetical protein
VADPLRITSVSTPHWGRASGREVNVSDGLVVFYGLNESGKSSFATAIAVLLAGPGTRDDLHRLGGPGDTLKGRLTAKLGAGNLNVEVTTKAPKGTGRATDSETVIADLDGTALNRAELAARLGGITLENYRNYYWVSAEEIFVPTDENEEHGGLSSRAIFGKLDPVKIGSDLKDEGFNQTGKTRGAAREGSARWHADKISELESRRRVAELGRDSWQKADSRLQQAIEEKEAASEALAACDDEIGRLGRAIDAVNLHLALETAQDDLRSTTEPTDDDVRLYAERESINMEVGRLNIAQATLPTAETACRLATEEAGDWADLPERVDTTEVTINAVQTAEGTIRSRRGDYTDAEALKERADAERRIPTEDRPRSARFMSPATALGLVVVALVLAVSGQGIPAAILGVAGAALLWRLRDGQPAKSGSDPRKKEAGGDVAEAKTRLEMAIRDRDNILLAAGIPAESIPADKDYLATCLGTLAKLKRSRSDWDRCRTDVTTCEATLIDYFPEGTQASGTKTLLDAAVGSVEAHETAREAVADAQRELREALGGRETPEEELLKANDRASLQTLQETALTGRPDLETDVSVAADAVEAARDERSTVSATAELQTPLLDVEAVNDIIRGKTVNGLAHLLAADLLVSSATAYVGDHQPDILRVAKRVATKICVDWTDIRIDPHSDQLRVESTNGEHSVNRLATGARSLLNLALRLGGLEVESEKLPVHLPIILDDALAHMDKDRRSTAFQELTEFADRHQVLYFTCHKHHADAATEAGASVINF